MRSFITVAVGLAVQLVAALAVASPPQAQPSQPAATSSGVAVLSNGFSLRYDHREILDTNTRLYLSSGNENFVDVPTSEILRIDPVELPPAAVPAPSSQPLDQVISAASTRHQIDPDLITSVIKAESGFNPRAKSSKGAQGLMQLMPLTASQLGVTDPFDIASNVDGGTRYLRQLLGFYDNDLAKALAAYNAGPARVNQYHGVPPYHETRAYVAKIINDFNRKKLAARHSAGPSHTKARAPSSASAGAERASVAPHGPS